MSNFIDKFQSGQFFHVYNRAVGSEKLFRKASNYYYFLSLYKKFLSQNVETYAYSLMHNHFHLLIRVKDELKDAEKVIGEAFRRCCISYAQAINVQENRKGSLFMRPLKRKRIEEEAYLTRVITYIHQNPSNHGVTKDFTRYKWSSYQSILSEKTSLVRRSDVINWFGGTEEFIKAHSVIREDKESLLKLF